MNLETLLFSQGFGSRRQCRALVLAGQLSINDHIQDDPTSVLPTAALATLVFHVQGQPWRYYEKAYVMLHKPAGVECSRNPQHHTSVFSLLPPPLIERGMQCVGRLDQDTTGLLLFSDDGSFVHAMTSPKKNVPKVYLAGVRHALDAQQLDKLQDGVLLHGETQLSRAVRARALDERTLELTIAEGKYHQVKRMVAAAGNRVETLHRSAIGDLTLPDDLLPGQWRWLDDPLRAAQLPTDA